MRFLVLGAHGMAGHTISLYLAENGHEVTGFDRMGVAHCRCVIGDARDAEGLRRLVGAGRYDVVVNCIGVLNRFADENREAAVFLNAYLPHFLAAVTAETDTRVIHMSTDCVFSGRRGGYTEDDLRDGESFYDRSKALGELEDDRNLTLRTSIVGPDLNPNGIGLLNWFMQQKGPVRGYTRVMWTGVTTLELARAMERAALTGAAGLCNLVHGSPISKHDLLGLFNRRLRGDAVEILADDLPVVDKSLKRTRFQLDHLVPDYETMAADLAAWMKAHASLYPHYEMSGD